MALNRESSFTDEEISILTKEIINDLNNNPRVNPNDGFMNWIYANNINHVSIPAPTPPPTCSTISMISSTVSPPPPKLILNAYAPDTYTSNHSLPDSLSLEIQNRKPAINGWAKYIPNIHSPSSKSKYIPYIPPPDIYTDDLSEITQPSIVSLSPKSPELLSPRAETPKSRFCDIPNFIDTASRAKKRKANRSLDDYKKQRKKRVSTPVIDKHGTSNHQSRTKHYVLEKSASYTSPNRNGMNYDTRYKYKKGNNLKRKHKKQCILPIAMKCVNKKEKRTTSVHNVPKKYSLNKKKNGIRLYKQYSVRSVHLPQRPNSG